MRSWLTIAVILLPLFAFAEERVSQGDYNLLMQASKLIEESKLQPAYRLLDEARDKVKSDYARALVEHDMGHIRLLQDRYAQALGHLTTAYDAKKLPEEQQTHLAHSLAQLNCAVEKWKRCLSYLELWMLKVPESVKAADYVMQAQAYAQLENWARVVKPIAKAVAASAIAPESWHQLEVSAHLQLQQWRSAIKAQKRLMRHYGDKPRNWRQLVSIHSMAKDYEAAMAVQRIGFERGLLRNEKDYLLLAQMMLQARIPYYAGKVLEAGLAKGVVKHNHKNLQLVSNAWIQAKENENAIASLARLVKVSPNRDTMMQLAQMQIEQQDWSSAQTTLRNALALKTKNRNGTRERLHLLLGITEIKLKRYESARRALMAAAIDENLKPSVDSWMQYLKQVGGIKEDASLERQG
jgi:tetratricopeptide (TPR) repeat protein